MNDSIFDYWHLASMLIATASQFILDYCLWVIIIICVFHLTGLSLNPYLAAVPFWIFLPIINIGEKKK